MRTKTRILILGGGFGGVETVAAINDFLRDAVRFYQTSRRKCCASFWWNWRRRFFRSWIQSWGEYARKRLAERGVQLSDGDVIPTGWRRSTGANFPASSRGGYGARSI